MKLLSTNDFVIKGSEATVRMSASGGGGVGAVCLASNTGSIVGGGNG